MPLFKDDLPRFKSKIRFLNSIPKSKKVDIYLDNIPYGRNLFFSELTKYFHISPGSYNFSIFVAGTYNKPIYKGTLNIIPNSIYTTIITEDNDNIYPLSIQDSPLKEIPQGLSTSFLRVINLCPNTPNITLNFNTSSFILSNIDYKKDTGYYPIISGKYKFDLEYQYNFLDFKKSLYKLELNSGIFYTIYILGLVNEKPPLGYLLSNDSIAI